MCAVETNVGHSLRSDSTVDPPVGFSEARTKAEQALLDTNVIFIGQGPELVNLARKRFAAGGRMTVLWTSEKCSGFYEPEGFMWSPPSCLSTAKSADDPTLRSLQHEICGDKPRKWIRRGADVVSLEHGMRYELTSLAVEELMPEAEDLADVRTWRRCPGIRVLGANDALQWEVSGHIVMASSEYGCSTVGSLAVQDSCRQAVTLFTESNILISLVSGFMSMSVLHYLSIKYEASDATVPVWRLMIVGGALQYLFLVSDYWGVALNGEFGRVGVGTVLQLIAGYAFWILVPVGNANFNVFWVCALSTVTTATVHLPLHCYFTQRLPTLVGVLWLNIQMFFSLGPWVYFYCLVIAYLQLNIVMPNFAALFLPVAVSFSEAFFVAMLGFLYNKVVYKGGHRGDQLTTLTQTVAYIHAFAENTRLASLLCGSITEGDYAFIPSLCIGFVLNIFTRFCWSRYCLARVVGLFSTRLACTLRPALVNKLHDELKFCVGYARFVVPFSLLLARYVAGLQVFFNTPALLCLLTTAGFEFCEDLLVYSEKIPFAPPIKEWQEGFATEPTFSPMQLIQACGTPGLKPPARALALHGTRRISLRATMSSMVPSFVFILCALQLVLGVGFLYGNCSEPLDPDLRMTQGFVWTRPLPCE